MAARFCTVELDEFKFVLFERETLILTLCVLILASSVVAIVGNLLVIRALCKASSIPAILKKLFLSLAISDLAMGLFAQPMFGVTIAVMLNMIANGVNNFNIFCPSLFTLCHFSIFLLASASLLNVTAIAADRLLAIFFHLRYQELVTPKRLTVAIAALWSTSAVTASTYILLPNNNDRLSEVLVYVGLFVTTVAYIYIYKTVRHHQNQIQSRCQVLNGHAVEAVRQKKSTINALFVYAVFLACYVPHLCCTILLSVDKFLISFLAAYEVSVFLVLLNSSLNPIVYCWRYREIREIVKVTLKELLCITENG